MTDFDAARRMAYRQILVSGGSGTVDYLDRQVDRIVAQANADSGFLNQEIDLEIENVADLTRLVLDVIKTLEAAADAANDWTDGGISPVFVRNIAGALRAGLLGDPT